MLTYTGQMAVYFNRHADAPRVWCIADIEGKWEIEVTGVVIRTTCTSRYEPVVQKPEHAGPPSAWFEVEGQLVIASSGLAMITPIAKDAR